MTNAFELDPRLAAASTPIADLELCQARLQDDVRWPWIVLVPRRPGLTEVDQLLRPDRTRLLEEAVAAGEAVRALGSLAGRPVEKLNLGALGNVVPQLHLHVVGRRRDDPAWPGPVWGFGVPAAYQPDALERARRAAMAALGANPGAPAGPPPDAAG